MRYLLTLGLMVGGALAFPGCDKEAEAHGYGQQQFFQKQQVVQYAVPVQQRVVKQRVIVRQQVVPQKVFVQQQYAVPFQQQYVQQNFAFKQQGFSGGGRFRQRSVTRQRGAFLGGGGGGFLNLQIGR